MFVVFMVLYEFVILWLGGIEDEEFMHVFRLVDRFGIDFGPLKEIAKFLMGNRCSD